MQVEGVVRGDELVAGGVEDEDFRRRCYCAVRRDGEPSERGRRVPVVVQEGREVVVRQPFLRVHGHEHGADAEEWRFEYESVDGWWAAAPLRLCDERAGFWIGGGMRGGRRG